MDIANVSAVSKAGAESKREPLAQRVWRGNSRIVAMGHYMPETVCPIGELLSQGPRFKEVHKHVVRMTGIESVRRRDADMGVADMAVRAIENLFEQPSITARGLRVTDVDTLIFGAVSREYKEPATAAVIHERLGLGDATALDVSNACLGFVDAWCTADAMLAAGQCKLALIVTAEIGTIYRDRAATAVMAGESPIRHFAAFTLGDGSAAFLLERKSIDSARDGALLTGVRVTYGEYSDLCIIPTEGGTMTTNAGRLFSNAKQRFASVVHPVLAAARWTAADVDIVITHQPSSSAIDDGCRTLGILPERALRTVSDFGNVGSASLPITFSKGVQDGAVRAGQRVLVVGFGSGIGVAALTVQF